jgi:pentatricopeptide repeat protein
MNGNKPQHPQTISNPVHTGSQIIKRHPLLAAFVLFLLLSAALYSPSITASTFIQHEDSILSLPLLSHAQNIPLIFSQDFLLFTSGQYRPVSYAVLAGVRTFISPDHVLFWHLWLLGFHLGNTILVFLLVRRFTPRLSAPFIAAAIFCLHPLCTIHINNINQFHTILGTTLCLGCLNAYTAFTFRNRASLYVLSVVLFFLAILTSRQGLTIGFLLLPYELLYNRTSFKHTALRMLPFALLPLLFYNLLFKASPHPLHYKYMQMYEGSFWDGFFSVTGTTGHVINGLLLTQTLPLYLHEFATKIFSASHPQFLVWCMFNAAVCITALWVLRRKGWAAWGLLLMYIAMLPYATVYFNQITEFVSFTYYYFPLAGMAVFASGFFLWLQDRKSRFLTIGGTGILFLLLLFWGARTYQINHHAQTPASYWQYVLSKAESINVESHIASTRLGKALLAQHEAASGLSYLFQPNRDSLYAPCLTMANHYLNRDEHLASAIHLHFCADQGNTGILYQNKSEIAARLYAAAGALDYAEDQLGVIIMVNPYNTAMMSVLADVWLQKGYVQEAHRMVQRIRNYDPASPDAARLEAQLQTYEQQVRSGNPPAPLSPPTPGWLDYAIKRKSSPDIRQQIILLSHRIGTRDPIIQLEAMLSLMEEERYTEALQKANTVYTALNNNAFACAAVCDVLVQTGDVKTAIEIGVRAIQLDPNNKWAWKNLGVAYAQKKEFDENDTAFLELIQKNSNIASLFYMNLGMQKREQGKHAEAVDALQKAIDAQPHNMDVYKALAESLSIIRQPQKAADVLRKSLTIKQDDPEVYANLGIVLLSLKKWDEGLEAFNTAIKLNPDNHIYHYNLAVALVNQKKLTEAVTEFQRTIHLKPDFLQAIFQLGYCLLSTGKLDEAAAQYKIIIQSDPAYPYVHYNLATVYRLQENNDQAITEYQAEIRHTPTFAPAYNALIQLYCQTGNFNQAQSLMKEAQKHKVKLSDAIVNQVNAAPQR